MDSETPLDGYYMASSRHERPALLADSVIAAPFHDGKSRAIDKRVFYEAIEEIPLPWTYLVPVAVSDLEPLLVGPLARLNIGFDTDTPWAELECTRMHEQWGHPLDRGVLFFMALTLEVMWAWEKARLLLEQRPRLGEACAVPELVESEGSAVIDSPRGTLVHHVRIDPAGAISRYRVISPLQFNYLMLNQHLSAFAKKSITGIDIGEAAAHKLQLAVRAFSPCVPCGTH
jgi:NAD-reducing hydrogenase large subunit